MPTMSEREILNKLVEEAAEVIQCCTKIMTFGFESSHPSRPRSNNIIEFSEEIGDLLCMIDVIRSKNLSIGSVVDDSYIKKFKKLRDYSNIDLSELEVDLW